MTVMTEESDGIMEAWRDGGPERGLVPEKAREKRRQRMGDRRTGRRKVKGRRKKDGIRGKWTGTVRDRKIAGFVEPETGSGPEASGIHNRECQRGADPA